MQDPERRVRRPAGGLRRGRGPRTRHPRRLRRLLLQIGDFSSLSLPASEAETATVPISR